MPDIAAANLPTLLPIDQACNQARVVAEVWVYTLKTGLDISEVLPDGIECPDNVSSKNLRCSLLFRTPKIIVFGARAERCNRTLKNITTEVITTLSAMVRDRVETGYALDQASLCLHRLGSSDCVAL